MRRIGLAVVLAVSLALAPLASKAQEATNLYRIAYLSPGSSTAGPYLSGVAFQALRDRGGSKDGTSSSTTATPKAASIYYRSLLPTWPAPNRTSSL